MSSTLHGPARRRGRKERRQERRERAALAAALSRARFVARPEGIEPPTFGFVVPPIPYQHTTVPSRSLPFQPFAGRLVGAGWASSAPAPAQFPHSRSSSFHVRSRRP